MLSKEELVEMIDLSAVQAQQSYEEFDKVIAAAIKHNLKCVFALPSHTPYMVKKLKDYPEILIGGVVGFPGGGTTTNSKVFECKELIELGANEIDMVINIAWLKNKDYDKVHADIAAVVEAANGIPVKTIFECHHLTDEEITKACELAVDAGVTFVKTGTGWAPTGATLENTALMSKSVDGKCAVKAAGGVRDLATIEAMVARGVTRFGIGVATALSIIEGLDAPTDEAY